MPDEKWQLYGFMNALREWVRRDPPPGDLLVKAAEFGAELERDPEVDAESEGANLYLRRIPGTEHDGRIVTITFVLTSRREVHCQDVACVPHPQGALFDGWPPARHHQK